MGVRKKGLFLGPRQKVRFAESLRPRKEEAATVGRSPSKKKAPGAYKGSSDRMSRRKVERNRLPHS